MTATPNQAAPKPAAPSYEIPAHIIEHIAERAAEKAIERVYLEVGKTVVKRVLWVIGAGTLAVFVWMTKHDLFS